MYTPSIQNKISELHQMLNINQTSNEKTNYLKKIIEVENKSQYWIDKYDELYEKHLRLEAKHVCIEKENCGKIYSVIIEYKLYLTIFELMDFFKLMIK